LGFIIGAVAACPAAPAAVIGPWPIQGGYEWQDQPIANHTTGAISILTPPAEGALSMPLATTLTRAKWLPYPGYPGEKFTIADLIRPSGRGSINSIHAKVYDPLDGAGNSGWALILRDSSGNMLDLGVRPIGPLTSGAGRILGHYYDGATWTDSMSATRARTGNSYYSIDVIRGADGTLTWTVGGVENGVPWASALTGTSDVVYGAITDVYLSASSPDNTGMVTYRWTEFYIPEPATLAILTIGGLLLMRRPHG
jgi:hypothetical protein